MYDLFPQKEIVSKEQFLRIIETFGRILNEYIIMTGNVVRLPKRLGTLSIRVSPPLEKTIDYKALAETGKIIYHNNYHSEGKLVSFHWDKNRPYCLSENSRLFKFVPARYHKKLLSDAVKTLLTSSKYFPKT